MNSMENKIFTKLVAEAKALGAFKANIIEAGDIITDRAFRGMCESNACGLYGKCWMCPPYVGEIDELMARVGKYDYALVYQTVTELEDSFDFEGMIAGQQDAKQVLLRMTDELRAQGVDFMALGCEGCGLCETCTYPDAPCRFPESLHPSIESYGVQVNKLAAAGGINYINGANTVTFFGCIIY